MYKFLTGAAGTGKTYTIRQEVTKDPKFGVLAATTGIAAVNLGQDCTTINSLLKFFDLETLKQGYNKGYTVAFLKRLRAQGYKNLIIEEVSMMSAQQLELIFAAMVKVNRSPGGAMGIILCGDLSQIPPVKGDYIFRAPCFRNFEIIKLTEIKRQSDPEFVTALNLMRLGKAKEALDYFVTQVGFQSKVSDDFRGTTIVGTNTEADNYNKKRLEGLNGDYHSYYVVKSGTEKSEWKKIPECLKIKVGALVMVLSNNLKDGYANGDLGYVFSCTADTVTVMSLRTESLITIKTVKRLNEEYEPKTKQVAIRGTITYMPLRVAWASTCHKSQGLSLDAVQINCGSGFLGETPGGLYTALSRCRTAGGLYLAGSTSQFINNCKVDPNVLPYL